MSRFRCYILQGNVRALFDNGLSIKSGENYLEIRKDTEYSIKSELKSWSKQYEISQEDFFQQLRNNLNNFPEIKEVINEK